MTDGVSYVHRNNRFAPQRHHHAESARSDQIHSGDTEAGSEYAVEWRRRTSPLNVPEHAHTHFFVRAGSDGVTDQVANRADAAVLFQFRRQLDAFRHHYDGEAPAHFFAFPNLLAD